MADEFITVPFETDHGELAQTKFDHLADLIPGWEPSAADPMTILLEADSLADAELMDVASDVPAAIFRTLGAKLHRINPIEATPAVGASTWTMIDSAGHTIPEGTVVRIPAPGDQYVAFETAAEVTVLPGQSATAAGEVPLIAVLPGAEGSGLTGAPELQDSLAFVQSVALVGQTTGGVDAETDQEYLDRLSAELELLAPRPILPDDFAVMAKRVPAVERATALDGYNPANQTFNNERMVTIAVVDAEGEALAAPVKADVDALLQAQREVNFVVHIIDPTYTTVAVTFTAKAVRGWDPVDVELRAEAALAAYLSPKDWGQPQLGEERVWNNQTKVRYLEVAEQLNRVEGLDYVESLQIGEQGGPLGTADVDLDGAASLPRPGTIAGTVTG